MQVRWKTKYSTYKKKSETGQIKKKLRRGTDRAKGSSHEL
jgi:hypothetical protein